MDVSTAFPFLLHLFAEYRDQGDEVRCILKDLESFLIRRMICRLNTRSYNTLFVELIDALDNADPTKSLSQRVRDHLVGQSSDATRWPDDAEFEQAFVQNPLHGRIRKDRLQMILEGVEMALRTEFSEDTVITGKIQLEHIMPRKWQTHWPLPEDTPEARARRDLQVETMGNLTLVSSGLNASMSNSDWQTKREALKEHSTLRLTNRLLNADEWKEDWNEETIRGRGVWLFNIVRELWSRPKQPTLD